VTSANGPPGAGYTWIYNNTDRSVLAVIVFHFLENFTGEFLGIGDQARSWRLALTVALAVGVVWRWGPRTLRRASRG